MSEQLVGLQENFLKGYLRGMEEARKEIIDLFSTFSNEGVIKIEKLDQMDYRETVGKLGQELLIKLDFLIKRVTDENTRSD